MKSVFSKGYRVKNKLVFWFSQRMVLDKQKQENERIQVDILKSQNDKQEYRLIRLEENKLECLLISDSQADSSACAMNVRVGNLADPLEFQGLSHFCEHMLFLGTTKYPIESEYKAFLSKHAGTQNASTGPMNTLYHFSCANGNAYESVLDRFAQFFISPLFTESCTAREMNAIENEHKKNFSSDTRRLYQIHRYTSKQGNVFNKFGSGNLETLQKAGVREALIQFHKAYYSANQMNLVLHSNESLDNMHDYASTYFKDIPNLDIQPIKYTDLPFGSRELSKYIKMIPVGESHTLNVKWQVDYHLDSYANKSVEYITHLLGHEGENSLLSVLISENLAYELCSGVSDNMSLYSEVSVDITLTLEGQNNIERVLHLLAEYVRFIRESPVQYWIWEEIKQIKTLNFQFKEKSSPLSQAVLLSRKISEYPAQDILISSYLMEHFNMAEIQHYLSLLTVDNMRISNLSKTLTQECNMIEPVYGTFYKIEDISQQVREIFESPCLSFQRSSKRLGFPLKNPFLPRNLSLVRTEECFLKEPLVILENESTRVWLKQDDKFKTPKGEVQLHLFWNTERSACNKVLQFLHMQFFKDRIRELQYLAKLSNIVDQRSSSDRLYKYSVSGFSDSIPTYTRHFIDLFRKLHSHPPWEEGDFEDKFRTLLERKLIALKNFSLEAPYQTVSNHLHSLLDHDAASIQDQLLFVQSRSVSEIIMLYKQFHSQLLSTLRFEWSFIGNFTKQDSISLALHVQNLFLSPQIYPQYNELSECISTVNSQEETLQLSTSNLIVSTILSKYEIRYGRTVQLEKERILVFEKELETNQKNSACYLLYQFYDERLERKSESAKECIFKSQNLFRILHNILKSPMFSQLRTKEQLGYIAQMSVKKMNKISGMTFLIQSSTKAPQYLSNRIIAFVESARQILLDLTEEDFLKFVESIRTKYKRKHLNIYEEASYFNDIIEAQGDYFDISDRYIADLDVIHKQDVIDLFEHLFHKEKRLLEIHLVSSLHKEQQVSLINERRESHPNFILSDSCLYAKNMLKLYPSFTTFK